MNRQERRNRQRAVEKDMNTLRKLPEKDLLKINEIINKVSKSKADEALNLLDRSFSAILISRGMTFTEVEELQEELGEFMRDDQIKLIELERENIDMAKLEMEVREFIEGMIRCDKDRKEIVEATMYRFPKVSKTAANNAYGKILEEVEVNDAANYILGEKEEVKKIKKEKNDNVDKNIVEVKKEKQISKFKIKKIELEGQFGTYTKEGQVVKTGEMIFNSLEELQEYKLKEIELFNQRMKEIEDVYNAEVG